MPIQVSCPACGLTLRVKDELLGKRVKCPKCSETFAAEEDGPASNESRSSRRSKAPAPVRDDMGDRGDMDDRGDDKRISLAPHRGTMVMVLGICSLGGLVIVPLAFAGVACGIIAWIFGYKDLQRIRNGEMDPEGEGATKAGMICGMIATIVEGLITLAQLVVLTLVLLGVLGTAGAVGLSCASCCCVGGSGAGAGGAGAGGGGR